MSTPDHDPERFYHCDCLDEDGEEHDDERFYHCTCIEDGFELDDGTLEKSDAGGEKR